MGTITTTSCLRRPFRREIHAGRLAWRDGKPGEGLIRTPLKDLLGQLDASHFAQLHRAVVVNLRAISHVTRSLNETAHIHLKGHAEILPVSRSYPHLFRQM
ncbi:LytTR family DNA-binding domain-containing protein [uncultured Nevskia sp.]|uniref:LytTR family DNA-binding domain-containing protein n=1 Tax=uncultured Nevskia sp. TaxID=228950 RepID=UPI0025D7FAE1|nr:LytTR family DNA-binding domain-containing protein [uncultured Nevskia sp.]